MTYLEGNQNLLRNLCTECATYLQGKYPHVAWGVRASVDGSMIEILPVGIGADQRYAFVEKTTVLQQATGRNQLLKRIGGEILERYRIDRAALASKHNGSGAAINRRGQLTPDIG